MKLMIHAHTTFSNDGELKPAQLASLARRRGFDAVLVSDHFESLRENTFARLVDECRQIRDCLMVPGYERSFRGYHILALGVDRWIADRNIQEWADNVRAAGGITAVAHPSRYHHLIPTDILEACDAVEVWNSKFFYDGEIGPNPKAYPLLGNRRYPLCSQDLHGKRHASPVGVRLSQRCTSGAEIIACLQRGEYRMTNGWLSYDSSLSTISSELLDVFHGTRRRAVTSAVRLRRWIRGGKATAR
jgi:hypothetical protein